MATSTLPDDKTKGHESDNGNIAQQRADNLYKNTPRSEAEADAAELARMEKAEAAGEGDRSLADATPEERRAALEDKEAAAQGDLYKNKAATAATNIGGRFSPKKLLSKKAAPAGIIGLFLAGFGGFTLLFGTPATMFAAAAAMLTNHENFAAPAVSIRAAKMIQHKIGKGIQGGAAAKQALCKNVAAIRCKTVTMSDSEVEELRKNGVTVEVDSQSKLSGRNIVNSVTFDTGEFDKDGKPIKLTYDGGQDINEFLRNNPSLRSSWYKRIFNPLTAQFFDSKFITTIKKIFNIDKSSKVTGNTEEEQRSEMNQDLGATDETDTGSKSVGGEEKKVSTTVKDKITAIAKPVVKESANFAAATACAAYSTSFKITALAKALQYVKYGQVFLFYAKEFQKFQAQPDGTTATALAKTAEILGDNWMYSEKNPTDSDGNANRFYNTSAWDAEGMKYIRDSDPVGLIGFAQQWIVGGNTTIGKIYNAQKTAEETFGGRSNIKTACKIANSAVGCVAVPVMDSIRNAIIGTAVGPEGTAGGAASGVIEGAVECLAWQGLFAAVFTAVTPFLADKIVSYATDLAGVLAIDDNTKGVDLGNVVAAGAGTVLGNMAASRGLRPSSLVTAKQYLADTADENEQIAQLNRYDARQTPFDTSNQYSFLGSIAYSIYDNGSQQNSLFGNISRLLAIIPTATSSIAGLTPAANAEWTMKDNAFNDAAYQQCSKDSQSEAAQIQGSHLEKFNVSPNLFCVEDYDMPSESMNMDIDKNQDFMIGNNGDEKYVDEEGKPLCQATEESSSTTFTIVDQMIGGLASKATTDDASKPCHKYAMYQRYCANREPEKDGTYGETMHDITYINDADENWMTGYYCNNVDKNSADSPTQEELDNFYTFTMDSGDGGISKTMDEAGVTTLAAAITPNNAGVCGLVNNPNVTYANPKTKEDLQKNCEGQTVEGVCGNQITIDPQLANTINTLSSKYKIKINNFGFMDDRGGPGGAGCDDGQHPLGKAIDINEIELVDGSGGTGLGITYGDPAKDKVLSEYATDWLNTLPAGSGGVGQRGCSSTFQPTLPAGFQDGNFFGDECNHLHIDVRGS